MSRHDVIIVGSGLGGLLCAGILARAGLNVLVLEQGTQPGGCLQTYRRHGLDFDTGFHYVGGLDEGTPMDSTTWADWTRGHPCTPCSATWD